MLVLLPCDTGSRRSIIFLSAGHAATTTMAIGTAMGTTTMGRQWRRRRWTNGKANTGVSCEGLRRILGTPSELSSVGREKNSAPRIPDTLTVVRRRRRAGTGTLAARISGEGWKPRPASSSSSPSSSALPRASARPRFRPSLTAVSRQRWKVLRGRKLILLRLQFCPFTRSLSTHRDPSLYFPASSSNSAIFSLSVSLCPFFFLSDFSTNSSRPTLCCPLPLFSLNPFCHPLYMYTRIARFASIQLLFPPQRPLSFDISLFSSLVLCSCFCYPMHCILSLPTSSLLPSARPLLLGRHVTTRPRFLTVLRTPLSLPTFPHLLYLNPYFQLYQFSNRFPFPCLAIHYALYTRPTTTSSNFLTSDLRRRYSIF